MVRSTGGWPRKVAALLLFATAQVVFADDVRQSLNAEAHQLDLVPKASDSLHGIQKRSVSILARNGDLPYFRKEWNKKLHPGFRGMNVEEKDEELVPSKRYVGSLARGGGYPTSQGKRADRSHYEDLEGYGPEEEPLETYIPDEWTREDESDYSYGKRGGISSLARSNGLSPYGSGKRSVAALARSGELLSIGRGSGQERDGSGSSASKRGLGSILRNGGISTIGKNPVHSLGSLANVKRGIESLARNYALPSMINQDYDGKLDLPEMMGDSVLPMNEPVYDEVLPMDEDNDAKELGTAELIAKRHLGSFVRTYGFKPSIKRNIGSVLRNGGFSYNGKRNEDFSPYEPYSTTNDKRHYSSLLKNQVPHKRDEDEDEEYGDVEKRHLSSILHDRNAYNFGKRYVGSIARQGLLGSRHEKKDRDWGLNEGQWSREDSTVGKRSISEDDTGILKGETYFDQQDDSRARNETAEDELKNAAGTGSSNVPRGVPNGQAHGETKKPNPESSKPRKRRSLMFPYSTSDEYAMPVLQNTDFYDSGNAEEEEWEGAPGKRFMGSLARWGWFPRQSPHAVTLEDGGGAETTQLEASGSRRWSAPEGPSFQLHKRHIGALARLGWLPAIRSQRRFSRGLGKRSEEEYTGGREDTAHGTQPAAYRFQLPEPVSSEASLAVREMASLGAGDPMVNEDPVERWTGGGWRLDPMGDWSLRGALTRKRYLLLPAIDHLLLRKLYPRQMLPLLV